MSVIAPTINGVLAYKLSIAFHLGEPEDISYTIYGPDAVSMLAGKSPPNSGEFDASFDGTTVDARMLSTGTEMVYDQPGYVTESGKSISYALQTSAIVHRFTAQQISVSDAFTGAVNTIATSDPNTICGGTIPDQGGIGLTLAGPYSFTFVVDSSVASTVLDVDINEDNVLHATQVITERMGSYVDPQRTMYATDSGDLNPSSGPQVTIGAMGASPHLTFGTTVPLLRMSTVQAQTTDQCKSCTFKGGDAHHGLPTSGRLTDMAVLNNSMLIVAVYGAINVGGVYFWPGDGALYPMTQAMGVNGIWYDRGGTATIFAATDAGVYTRNDDTLSSSGATRLGAMSLKCLRVQVEGSEVYTLALLTGATDAHVLHSTPGSSVGVGYNDWTQITSHPSVTDFAVMNGFCYCMLRDQPGALLVHDLSAGTATVLAVTSTASIIGLDPMCQSGTTTTGIFIRTSLGSGEIYYLDASTGAGTIYDVNHDTSLVDSSGSPILVNSIRANVYTALTCTTNSVSSIVLASTSLGVFSCPFDLSNTPGYHNWQRTDGQSSIGDFNATFAGAGQGGGTYSGRIYQPVYAIADNALYVSQNGSVNWIDVFSLPLDAGPFFYNYFRTGQETGHVHRWPLLTDISADVVYNGVPYTLQRILTHIGEWTYELINPTSTAPAAAHRSAEISQISAPALLPDLTASTILVNAMARFLAYTKDPQIAVEVDSFFAVTDTTNPLRTLRQCMQVGISSSPDEYLIGPGLVPFTLGTFPAIGYVLDHTLSYDRDVDPSSITTTTRIGTILLMDRTDPAKIAADLMYQVSRQQLYKGRSRR